MDSAASRQSLGRRRLMRDIKELVEIPYPNIEYHIRETDPHGDDDEDGNDGDDNMTRGCLILSPEDSKKLHLSVEFEGDYPLDPPTISINSAIDHPNVYGDWICATVLRKTDEYTPAYTLKGIAIQMLSFFGSDSLEQEHGDGKAVNLVARRRAGRHIIDSFECRACGFRAEDRPRYWARGPEYADMSKTKAGKRWSRRHRQQDEPLSEESESVTTAATDASESSTAEAPSSSSSVVLYEELSKPSSECYIERLPNEMLLLILERLDYFEHLTRLAQAWPRVSRLIQDFNVIRQRELQCFVLKQNYRSLSLGVGVSVTRGGQVSSEFDLLSHDAFYRLGVRQSVHNLPFEHWLPLPISWRHWGQVRGRVDTTLKKMAPAVVRGPENGPVPVRVVYHFMNDIVVRLNEVASKADARSSLRHASEKAIESYFHLFHLLVCMACESPAIVRQANAMLQGFAAGRRSKKDCPNLGHLLVALLVSDVNVTDDLRKAIITEAITRNVVWLLDEKGANRPELSYLEPSAVSSYRLEQTFRGSLTSYRLLMFSELFRRTARPYCVPHPEGGSSRRKTLLELRAELFARNGAPPPGSAARLSAEVRRLHTVNTFPQFLREMGVRHIPTAANFTAVLRQTMKSSVDKGYSTWALPRYMALALRIAAEPDVEVDDKSTYGLAKGCFDHSGHPSVLRVTFFPKKKNEGKSGGEARRGERRGQGRRR
jgi:ubiquitin-protein ligase